MSLPFVISALESIKKVQKAAQEIGQVLSMPSITDDSRLRAASDCMNAQVNCNYAVEQMYLAVDKAITDNDKKIDARDPREDPFPGDVLRSAYGNIIVVMQRNDDVVMYIDIGPEQDEIRAKYLANWMEEHKTTNGSFMAEVIYVSHF